ncbi:hypothetical protein CSAL01_06891 [Colletotrichum salicis]|uniref:Uncharacterized protein n=1 Tax=Colletotrichum salicis TaxID=1209931 RepID=A0A135UQN6_9PEZI|nr:hypothetical protein CSAL01_06891 [Colletotrichum salicis]
MLGVFVLLVIMNFIFRITHLEGGICIIGMEQPVLLPFISFDAAVNVYLTILFLLPLLSLHSVKYNFWKPWTLDWRDRRIPRAPPNVRLRRLVIRTFIGSCCTLLSSVTYISFHFLRRTGADQKYRNLSVLMALNGEVAWLCLLCCNTDIFFSALVINWITSPGQESTLRTLTRPSRGISTLRDDAVTIPLDPDGNSTSTRKTWEQRRSKTPTAIGLESAEALDDGDTEPDERHNRDDDDAEADQTSEREARHSDDEDDIEISAAELRGAQK